MVRNEEYSGKFSRILFYSKIMAKTKIALKHLLLGQKEDKSNINV